MAGSVVVEKSKAFALRIVKLYAYLRDHQESILSKQVLRSGTSIGANIAEGVFAQSKDDFAAKYGIALKEASETLYWIDLLIEAGYLPADPGTQSLRAECEELIRILAASVKTAKPRSNG